VRITASRTLMIGIGTVVTVPYGWEINKAAARYGTVCGYNVPKNIPYTIRREHEKLVK